MSEYEVARRLVGGVWKTEVVNEAPSGGSQPGLNRLTITAAELAAVFESEDTFHSGAAAIPIDVPTDALMWFGGEDAAPTIDGDLEFYGIYAYQPDASSLDVYNNGEQLNSSSAPGPWSGWNEGTYRNGTDSLQVAFDQRIEGAQFYVLYVGTDTGAPSEGEVRVVYGLVSP